ncbi:MAG: tetratricopeptide repeat protein [Aureispira sp.]
MKIHLILLLSCLYFGAFSQSYKTVYELQEIQQQDLYLSKLLKIKGTNRSYISFQLPPNTVYWMYAFGTTVNKQSSSNKSTTGFKKSLMDLVHKGGKIAFSALDALTKPSGVAAIDVHLTNYEHAKLFLSKDDFGIWNYSAPLSYSITGSRLNLTAGIITSQVVPNYPLCLTFKNPSIRQGVSISVTIYAYVAKEVYVDEWTNASMNQLNKNCLSFFSHNNEDVQKVCGCVIEAIETDYRPKAFFESSKERQDLAFDRAKQNCYHSTNTQHLEAQDAQIKQLLKEIQGLQETKDYTKVVSQYEAVIALGKKDATTYNNLAWACLLSQQFDKAKQYLTAGLGEAPNNLHLQGNLAHYYLITGNFEAAKAIYTRYKNKQLSEEVSWKKMVQQDLRTFEDLDIYHPDFNAARRMVGLPQGRLAQVFDTRYAVGGKVTFQRGSRHYVGEITTLDKEKGENSLTYQNIYGEPQSARLSVLQVTPLSDLDYQEKLQAWQAEIAKYQYSLGEIGSWQKQQKTVFGRIIQLNDNNHKATLEHQNIYGETIQSSIPYLDIRILSSTEHSQQNQAWQKNIQQYQFKVGEQVSWSTKNLLNGLLTIEQGEIIQLNAQSHQAHIRYLNKKGKERVLKKAYLLLTKLRV